MQALCWPLPAACPLSCPDPPTCVLSAELQGASSARNHGQVVGTTAVAAGGGREGSGEGRGRRASVNSWAGCEQAAGRNKVAKVLTCQRSLPPAAVPSMTTTPTTRLTPHHPLRLLQASRNTPLHPAGLAAHLRNVFPWRWRLCMSVSEPRLAMCQRTLHSTAQHGTACMHA